MVSKAICCGILQKSAPCFHVTKTTEAMNNCRFWPQWLETGLPAFQLPMFSKCDALRKGDLWDMFVKGIHSFCEILASTPYQKLKVTESGSTLHQLCIIIASCLQKRELRYPRFGLQDIDCDLGCLIYATAASQ